MSYSSKRAQDILSNARTKAHKSGYKLLSKVNQFYLEKNIRLNIATAESLTGGMMFSTLVDIPGNGWFKYGAFSVYDTDAKRVFLGVTEKNVYTHKCAKEMAVGVLKNSNATLAIAVTGNAMPYQGIHDDSNDIFDNIKKVGEVFIGIAGYRESIIDTQQDEGLDTDFTASPDEQSKSYEIVVQTFVINACHIDDGKTLCDVWYKNILEENKLNRLLKVKGLLEAHQSEFPKLVDGRNYFEITSLMSNYIRNITTSIAFEKAVQFIDQHQNLVAPHFIRNLEPTSIMPYQQYNNVGLNKQRLRSRSVKNIICVNKTGADCNNNDRIGNLNKREYSGGWSHKKTKTKRIYKKKSKRKN